MTGRERERIEGRHVGVVDAANLSAFTRDLAQVRPDLDAAARAPHESLVEAGQLGDALDDTRDRLRVGAAFQQILCVFAAGVGDHVSHRGGRQRMFPLEIGCRYRRQRHDPRHGREIAVLVDRRVEIRRHEHEPVQRHADLRLQVVRDPWTAIPAVAFADQILLRPQAPVLHQPVVDGHREIVNVVLGVVELALGVVGVQIRTAETGADRDRGTRDR